MDNQEQINQLLNKLETLLKRQDDFYKEINNLRIEINRLKTSTTEQETKKEDINLVRTAAYAELEIRDESVTIHNEFPQQLTQQSFPPVNKPTKVKSDLEKFIGENLINKIGIAIIVLGVAIGAKYAISHQLISPLTRIILGYIMGTGLLGFAIKLKKKYENFSAVLLSGAMAIMYFITYSAYGFYDLFPQVLTFVLMVFFTAFTVLAATTYNKQVIAHMGWSVLTQCRFY
jgi:hypothetical protein